VIARAEARIAAISGLMLRMFSSRGLSLDWACVARIGLLAVLLGRKALLEFLTRWAAINIAKAGFVKTLFDRFNSPPRC
jgi:hypothetical protein